MKIERLNITNFRNISSASITPHSKINVIYGDNAQGKTNIIEAVWLFTGARSFRDATPTALIKHGEIRARLDLDFWGGSRENQAVLKFGENKAASLNQIPLSSAQALTGSFKSVVFSPAHLSIVKEGPQLRRSFLDIGISQLKPRYAAILKEHKRILDQRNALLKSKCSARTMAAQLDIFDMQFARAISTISKTRCTYLARIAAKAEQFYKGISRENEEIKLVYQSSITALQEKDFNKEWILETLLANREKDISAFTSTIGTHRDDVFIWLQGHNARTHGSQGQQRSIVLALKLAEAEIFCAESGEHPVVLLDDVLSELDAHRREFLLENLLGPQIFITCCEPLSISSIKAAQILYVKEGNVQQTGGEKECICI